MNEHPIGNLMTETMAKIKEMVDTNTVVGEPITIISKLGENLILKVKESRIAIGHGLASRIQIEGKN